jgi:hypothetical protein
MRCKTNAVSCMQDADNCRAAPAGIVFAADLLWKAFFVTEGIRREKPHRPRRQAPFLPRGL